MYVKTIILFVYYYSTFVYLIICDMFDTKEDLYVLIGYITNIDVNTIKIYCQRKRLNIKDKKNMQLVLQYYIAKSLLCDNNK